MRGRLGRWRLTTTRETVPALPMEAAREKWTYLDFSDQMTRRAVDSEQDKRVRRGMTIAHFPRVRTVEGFDFAAPPAVDERLVREWATGSFVAQGTNVLPFGAPGLGKTPIAIGLGRRPVEWGHTVLFTTATGLLSVLGKAESEGRLEEELITSVKPRLLSVDELGYLPFERRAAHLSFPLVNRRYERGSRLITTNRRVNEWGTM